MNTETREWFTLTPAGALRAFADPQPDEPALQMQALLTGDHSLDARQWCDKVGVQPSDIDRWQSQAWVEALPRRLQGPDAQLDDFVQHVIAGLSSDRQVALASDGGFCLGRAGLEQDAADVLCAAAADFGDYAARQARRGWHGAARYIAFHADSEFLLPSHAFVPFWVDQAGYWLVIAGEPLLNSPALVELMWGIKLAGTRFTAGL